jgi:hypothetical protein
VRRHVDASLWYNLPGIVAAYQPIAAPDHIAARQNMGAGLLGKYTATPGVAPTWSPVTGWTFVSANATRLATGIIPIVTWSILVCGFATGMGGGSAGAFFREANLRSAMIPYTAGYQHAYANGGSLSTGSPIETKSVMAFAGQTAYLNGRKDGDITAGLDAIAPIFIGNREGGDRGLNGVIASFAAYSRILTATEVALASMQMKFCTQPEFSVWSRQRDYWFAPTGGFLPAWATGINTQIGMGTGAGM